MAYSGTMTLVHRGGDDFEVTVEETDAAAGSECSVSGLPEKCTLLRQQAVLESGAGTTIAPTLGRVTAADGLDILVQSAAADVVDNLLSVPVITNADGTVYHRSLVDAGTNNVIRTTYYLRRGW